MRLKEIKPEMVIHCKTQEEANELCGAVGASSQWKEYWETYKDDTCYQIGYHAMKTFGNSHSYSDFKITEFSDLILPELTAEEVLNILNEIRNCVGRKCNDCPFLENNNGERKNLCTTNYGVILSNPEKLISICQQWKSDHEKKEPEIETEWFWQGRIFKINEDGCYYQIKDGTGFYDTGCEYRESAEEYMADELKEYCKTHKGKFIAVVEHVCRVKK